MHDLTVLQPVAPTALERLVDDYLMACRARGLAKATIDNSYGYPLRGIFLPWCAQRGIDRLEEFDARASDAFAATLFETGGKRGTLSKSSVHAYVRALRGFLTWCKREGETVKAEPALPRLPRLVLDVLTRDEIDALEQGADNERDRLIIRILADTGMRAAELCAITPEDIVRRDRQALIRVHGKGERDRLVPIMPDLLRRTERHIRSGRPADARGNQLFLSRRRGPYGDYGPLTPSGLLQLIRGAADRAGIKKRVTTHLLRHSFVTNALRGPERIDSMQLADIVGHSSLRMIQQVYGHLNSDDDYDAMARLLRRH